ncbi:MAG: transcriptional regulator [Clostridia bacterium]|nr:MAG: transcriptional regulator [Clostridia bacterium]
MAIVSKLAAIMGERGIRHISGLSEQTGIARSTLTKLWYNRVKGVTFDMLEKLCEVLECQPGDLLVYEPDNAQDGQQGTDWARSRKVRNQER